MRLASRYSFRGGQIALHEGETRRGGPIGLRCRAGTVNNVPDIDINSLSGDAKERKRQKTSIHGAIRSFRDSGARIALAIWEPLCHLVRRFSAGYSDFTPFSFRSP